MQMTILKDRYDIQKENVKTKLHNIFKENLYE